MDLFLNSEEKTKREKIDNVLKDPEKYNLASFLSFKVSKSVFDAINWTKAHQINKVDSDLLLHFLLKENHDLDFVFHRILIDPDKAKSNLSRIIKEKSSGFKERFFGGEKEVTYSEDFYETFLKALKRSSERKHKNIEIGDILSALAETNNFFKNLISENKIKPKDIKEVIRWLEFFKKERKERKKWLLIFLIF